MKAYYFIFFITFLISLLYRAKDDKQWRWKLFWTFLPLFIYGAIRVDYGNDYPAYEELFEVIHSFDTFKVDKELHAEVGFQFLCRILPSFRLLLVLNAMLLSLSFGCFCYHNVPKKYLWLAILLIFLNPEKNIFGSLVGIRNGLVVTSFLLGFVLVQNRKLVLFTILTIMLAMIHTSALLFLPVAYLAGTSIPFKKWEILLWVGAAVALQLFSMSQLSEIAAVMIDNDIFNRYESYLEGTSHRGGLMVFASLAFMIMYIQYFIYRNHSLDAKKSSLIRMGILFNVTMLMGSLSSRASYFYDMFLIASAVSIFADREAPQWLRYSIVILVIATSLYSMQVWMNSEWWNHGVYHSLIGNW